MREDIFLNLIFRKEKQKTQEKNTLASEEKYI